MQQSPPQFADGIYTCLSYIHSAKKKCIFFQRKSLFSIWANDGGNLENRCTYFGVSVAYKSFITLINRAASDYGDSVIAGMGAVTRITSMGTLVVFGFLKGFQPIAGFSYGAKKFDRLREAIKTSIIWSTSFCLVVGLAMAIFSTQIISQFTDGDTQMILAGQKSLFAKRDHISFFLASTRYIPLCFLHWAKVRQASFWGACRQGICFVPVILCCL